MNIKRVLICVYVASFLAGYSSFVPVGGAAEPIEENPPVPSVAVGADKDVRAQAKTLVAREWRGQVLATRADDYYKYLFDAGIANIQKIPGNLGVEVLRRPSREFVEFVVISYWESREAIKRFAGEAIEKPHHLPKDPDYLIKLPTEVLHYDVTFSDLRRAATGD